jgi:phage baseplate assembly protein W
MINLINKINPLDQDPRKAVGIQVPLLGSNLFTSTYQTKDAIRINLLNFILTHTGERYFNLNIGTEIRKQLFENFNNNNSINITQDIQLKINAYFPRVIIKEIKLTSIQDSNVLNFYLKYGIKDSNTINEEISINIEE